MAMVGSLESPPAGTTRPQGQPATGQPGYRTTGSTWTRTGSSLRAERTRCSSPRASLQGGALRAGHADHGPRPRRGRRRRPRPGPGRAAPRPSGRVEQRERVVDRAGAAGDGGQPAGRRQVRRAALRHLAAGEPGRVPAHQRLERPGRRGRRRPAPGRPGATSAAALNQRRSASSSVRRSSRAERQPGVEQHHGGVPALGDRLGARGGDHDRRLGVDGGQHPLAAGGAAPRCPGKARPSSSAVRRLADAPAPAARGGRTRGRPRRRPRAPHQRTGRRRGRPGEAQRPGAGRAARRGAAALAGQAGRRSRSAGSAPAPALSPGRVRMVSQACLGSRVGPGPRVAGQVAVAGTAHPDGDPVAQRLAGRGDARGPSRW